MVSSPRYSGNSIPPRHARNSLLLANESPKNMAATFCENMRLIYYNKQVDPCILEILDTGILKRLALYCSTSLPKRFEIFIGFLALLAFAFCPPIMAEEQN